MRDGHRTTMTIGRHAHNPRVYTLPSIGKSEALQ
jgi:hypothetical protein